MVASKRARFVRARQRDRVRVRDLAETLGDAHLGGVDVAEEAGAALGQVFGDDMAAHAKTLERMAEELRVADLEELGGDVEELFLQRPRMSRTGTIAERLQDARFEPLRRVLGDAGGLRDFVGRGEADAAYLERQAIRLARDDVDRPCLVLALDAVGQGGGDAVRGELHEDLAHFALLAPGLGEALGAAAAETGDLRQALGFLVEDAEGVEAEMGHDPLRALRADAGDGPGPQVALEPGQGVRREDGDGGGADLLAVLPVDLDAPPDADPAADRDRGERADDGAGLLFPVHEHPDDAKGRGGALEGDSLHLPLEHELSLAVHRTSL